MNFSSVIDIISLVGDILSNSVLYDILVIFIVFFVYHLVVRLLKKF